MSKKNLYGFIKNRLELWGFSKIYPKKEKIEDYK